MKAIRAIIIDDDQQFLMKADSGLVEVGFTIERTIDIDEAKTFDPGADLLVIDSMRGEDSYWENLLAPMRELHPSAMILLVTRFEDKTVLSWAEENKQQLASLESRESKHLLEVDPLVTFLPKSEIIDDSVVELKRFAMRVKAQIEDRRRLESILLECALRATQSILETSVQDLVSEIPASKEKKGTYGMDVITEQHIAECFGPDVNTMDILICTEELGLQNHYHHRVSAPRFFIFSDPFDGSSRTRTFLQEQVKNNETLGSAKLAEVVARPEAINNWEKDHGSHAMNSPTVSVVLAERHRVVATVIVNLFTQEVYAAVEAGIFVSNVASVTRSDASSDALCKGQVLPTSDGWTRIDFRDFADVSTSSAHSDRLFLGTLQARKVNSMAYSAYYDHAAECIGPVLPVSFNKSESFRLRYQQFDFTPGPGRILFMLKGLRALETYESFGGDEGLSGQKYGCVLSSGEPLTEWIGWLAFLRHGRGKVSAYCLRPRKDMGTSCTHKVEPNAPATLTPSEVNSIFKDGAMDLLLLPAGYGRSMRHYHDTLAVVFDRDPDWQKALKDQNEKDIFVKIPTF